MKNVEIKFIRGGGTIVHFRMFESKLYTIKETVISDNETAIDFVPKNVLMPRGEISSGRAVIEIPSSTISFSGIDEYKKHFIELKKLITLWKENPPE